MMTEADISLAYVDGDLPVGECREIEARNRVCSEIAEKVALLRASRLDFADAFARQTLPPIPDSPTQKIEELARTSRRYTGSLGSKLPSRCSVALRRSCKFRRPKLRRPRWACPAFQYEVRHLP